MSRYIEEVLYRDRVRHAQQIADDLEAVFTDLQTQVAAWYGRYATEDGITMAEARRRLRPEEVKLYSSPEHRLASHHISRLEALEQQLHAQTDRVFRDISYELGEMFGIHYQEAAAMTAWEIDKKTGLLHTWTRPDKEKIERILTTPWAQDELTFDERLTRQATLVRNATDQALLKMAVTGQRVETVEKELIRLTGQSAVKVRNMLHTEDAVLSSLAEKDQYRDFGVEKYQFLATLDDRTSDECRALDGEIFNVKDMEPGVNAPPMHNFCRSTTEPVLDEETMKEETGTVRIARDDKQHRIYIPGNITYHQYKEKYYLSL